ncbi:MAG: hypothetical protein KFH98_14015 [Gemmatimonadetes bacterium]|nr:hypothetical protein [Gemmatimonadota bacterium]
MTPPLHGLAESQLFSTLEQCDLVEAAARAVLERGPFPDDDALCAAVDSVILGLDDPTLTQALEAVPAPSVERGDPDAHAAALLAIRLYRDRFGYPFVSGVATPTAEELLMRVRIRLGNDPEPENRAAREHLRRHVRRHIQAAQDRVTAG